MKENEPILKRQKYSARFKNEDMDFMLNWMIGVSQVIGMSPSQDFHAVQGIKDGDPGDWREGFRHQGHNQIERANAFVDNKQKLAAGHSSKRAGLNPLLPRALGDKSSPVFGE